MRTLLCCVSIFAMLASAPLAAQTSAPAPAVSAQERYNQAQAAYDREDWAEAAHLFGILVNNARNPNSESMLEIRTRYGNALSKSGQTADGVRILEGVLAARQASKAEPDQKDALETRQLLARAYMLNFDYAKAAGEFKFISEKLQLAWQQLGDIEKFEFLLDHAISDFWSGNAQGYNTALARIDEAIALLEAQKNTNQSKAQEKRSKELLAFIVALKGRFAATHGDLKAANSFSTRALNLAGGITSATSVLDRSVRQDAALVAYLRNDITNFATYSGMSGAGRLGVTRAVNEEKWLERFSAAAQGGLPLCAALPEAGPDDIVVVQFVIGTNGKPVNIQPIYSSKRGVIERAFLEAVRDWSFADAIADMSGFWRSDYRVSLRCQNTINTRQTKLESPAPVTPLLAASLTRLGLPADAHQRLDDNALYQDMVRLASSTQVKTASAQDQMVFYFVLSSFESNRLNANRDYFKQAIALSEDPSVNPLLAIYFDSINFKARTIEEARSKALALGDLDMIAWTNAHLAREYERTKRITQAKKIYQEIVALALPAEHPLRQQALLRLAAYEAKKAPERAEALIAQAGLEPEQCALFEAPPVLKSRGSVDIDNFFIQRGWVQSEMDITPDGKTQNVRIVASYPAFFYDKPILKAYQTARFQPLASNAGCVAHSLTQRVIQRNE